MYAGYICRLVGFADRAFDYRMRGRDASDS